MIALHGVLCHHIRELVVLCTGILRFSEQNPKTPKPQDVTQDEDAKREKRKRKEASKAVLRERSRYNNSSTSSVLIPDPIVLFPPLVLRFSSLPFIVEPSRVGAIAGIVSSIRGRVHRASRRMRHQSFGLPRTPGSGPLEPFLSRYSNPPTSRIRPVLSRCFFRDLGEELLVCRVELFFHLVCLVLIIIRL